MFTYHRGFSLFNRRVILHYIIYLTIIILIISYENGNIAVYSIEEDYLLSKLFKLHKSEITYLALNNNYLASGSKDTNIFVWDIIGESALYK